MKKVRRTKLYWIYALSVIVVMNLATVSCTFDYFVDETNYRVFVPEVEANEVDNCIVLVYEADGQKRLLFRREAVAPFNSDRKEDQGIFNFKLFPGNYNVLVVANTQKLVRVEESPGVSYMSLKGRSDVGVANAYSDPGNIHYELMTDRTIEYPAPLKIDVAHIVPVTGYIRAVFKQFPSDVVPVNSIDIMVSNVGIKLPFVPNYSLGRYTDNDIQVSTHKEVVASTEFQIINNYFPSILGQVMKADIVFRNSAGVEVMTTSVYLTDDYTATGTPWVLNPSDVLTIEFDGNFTVVGISLMSWDELVQSGGDIIGI